MKTMEKRDFENRPRGNDLLFKQDDDPKHVSRLCRNCL